LSERFFCDTPVTGDRAQLTGPEAHHLLHVMRLAPGDRVVLFDGAGAEFDAVVQACGRTDVQLSIESRREVNRELPAPLVLGVALPKGDRQKVLVEKLTELGASRLVPLVTARSVVKLSDGGRQKLARLVIEASKQCGRNRLMTIDPPQPLAEFLASAPADADRWIAHPSGSPLATPQRITATWCAVGPEGGFADDEVELAQQAGWQCVTLGPRILRIETAAIALASRMSS
jgi:16S rRNA (uracil1498-N3)-methyltransferase